MLVADPVVLMDVIEWVQIDLFRALVERFRYRLNDQNVIEIGRIIQGLGDRWCTKARLRGPAVPTP